MSDAPDDGSLDANDQAPASATGDDARKPGRAGATAAPTDDHGPAAAIGPHAPAAPTANDPPAARTDPHPPAAATVAAPPYDLVTPPADADAQGRADAAAQAELQADRADLVEDASALAKRLDKRIVLDADGLPQRMRWRPHISLAAMAIGAVADIAVELILQQVGLLILDTRDLVEGIVQGSVLGAMAPMMGTFLGVIWVNHRITGMRAEAA